MTITNQTNPIGSNYESKRSTVFISQKDGGLFGKSEKIYTSTRLTKISNTPGPNQYRVEVFQHTSPSGGSSTQIGTVVDGKLVLNSAVEYGNAFSEDSFRLQVEAQIKNQKKDAEKQIKNKVSSDTESIFVSEELTKDTGITEDDVENGLGGGRVDDSRELRQLNLRKDAIDGTRRTKNTYGVMFYPSFIEKSAQDKLKITILEFAPKKERKGKYEITKKKQVKASGFIYEGSLMDKFTGISDALGTKKFEDVTEKKFGALPRDQLSFDTRKRMEFQKRSLGHMTLPIPDGVSDANRVNYGNGNLSPLQAGLADVASAALMGTGETVTGELGEAFTAATDQGDQVQKIIGAFAAETTLKVNPSELIARTEGQVFNNNLELLFQGPTLRTFNFRYKFSPRDESEIKNVMKIIRAFKQSSAVQRSQSGLFLVAPNTYRLEFKKGGEKLGTSNRHRFLPRIKECALTQCTVDYMPEGSYMTYDSDDLSFQGSMVTYIVTLSFQELDPIFNDDYEDQDLGGIGF